MISYIDEYNDLVEKECIIKNKKKKEKLRNGLLNPNLKFSSSLNAFIPPPDDDDDSPKMNKNDFINVVKSKYESLGKELPSDVEIEDVFDKVNSMLNNQQIDMNHYISFMKKVNGFDNVNDAFNHFISNLDEYKFINEYPPVGQEAIYGFSEGTFLKRDGEKNKTLLQKEEMERRRNEKEFGSKFGGQRAKVTLPRHIIEKISANGDNDPAESIFSNMGDSTYTGGDSIYVDDIGDLV